LRGKVGVYHGDLPLQERARVHTDFMRDRYAVVCCTLAFGMGIDKSNIRHVVHYGMPSSLESYYQQAGRAGRDGIPARCTLLWAQSDAATHATIKGAGGMDGRAAEAFNGGLASMLGYCTSAGCRHAGMVNHFDPGTFVARGAGGACAGGCDNCAARAAGTTLERDVGREVGQLLAVLAALGGYFGLGKALLVLRGSKSKDMKPQWLALRGPDGAPLHGCGASKSEEWWKGVAEVAMAQGLAAMETRAGAGSGRSYTVVVATDAGRRFLAAPGPLVAALPAGMMGEERAAAAAAAAAAARVAEAQARSGEEAALERRLREVRSAIAAAADLAPENVVSDAGLREIARVRPDSAPHLQACEGCGAAFIQRHGQAFVEAVLEFCRGSATLKAGTPWRPARPASGGRAPGGLSAPAAQALLAEPRGAAMEAHSRFASGQTLATIATTGRPKPINPMTVAGYLADAAGAGAFLDWPRLAGEAAVTEARARAAAAAIRAHGDQGVGAVKRALPPDFEYGQVKVVAAMMRQGVLWFDPGVAAGNGQGEGESGEAEPAAKRARTSTEGPEGGAAGEEEAEAEAADEAGGGGTPATIDPPTVLNWLQTHGPTSGAALAQRFCRGDASDARRRLSSVLGGLCDEMAVCRRGGAAATSAAVDLQDADTMYMLL
jgi:ATP-dependent DNA helicase RecQ